MKRMLLSIAAVFLAWAVMDFIIHGVILSSSYQATASLWRPAGEMKFSVLYAATLITAAAFVVIFARFFSKKGIIPGLAYGFLFGIAAGVPMGYGSYSFMPIPYYMALSWFLGTLLEAVVGGLIVGAIITE